MKGRIELNLLFVCGVAIVLIVLGTACGEQGPVTPTALGPQVEPALPSGGSGGTTPTVNPPGPTTPTGARCDIIQLQRAGVKVETHCEKGVRFYVPADPTMGKGYFNVWMPAVNDGVKHGPFSYYEWTKWLSMDPGRYDWALAAETKTEDGTVYQCDWHKREFTIPTCRVIPPECPAEAYFNITVDGPVPTDNKRLCPDFKAYTYEVSTNLPVVEMILPPGWCTATSPTTGKCQFPVEETTYQVTIGGRGFIWNVEKQIQCGEDFETILIEGCCDECVSPDPNVYVREGNRLEVEEPPDKMYYTVGGDPTKHYEAGTYGPFAEECDSEITIRVNFYDETCPGEDVLCTFVEETFKGPESCVGSESLTCRFNNSTHKVVCKAHVSHTGRIFMSQGGEYILTENFTEDSAFFSDEMECGGDPVRVKVIHVDAETCEDPVTCGVVKTLVEIPECPECEPPGEDCIRYFGRKQCSDFGLVSLYKNDDGGDDRCTIAEMDAIGVIVKGGVFYNFHPNVIQGDEICTCGAKFTPDWSHVEYCGCPQEW